MNTISFDINALVQASQESLLEMPPHIIEYKDRQALKNNRLPPALTRRFINVYALWTRAAPGNHWTLMYIGQRSHRFGWSRIAQHLFSTPKGTQSKLNEVRAAIESGAEMGITAILVEPDSMRLSVEEELINRNSASDGHLIWNRRARSKLPELKNGAGTYKKAIEAAEF